ncbi:MAG TPA: hypothetical protein VLS89_10570, partial [Candidatus Nanopelagicales bacterium]|nr:hypothetical protein [Candidatus Nanopelagicales bacterium]
PLGAALAPLVSPTPLLFSAALALIAIAYGVERARAAARPDAHRPLGPIAWQRLLVLALLALLTVPAWMAEDLHSRALTATIAHARDTTWLYGLQGLCVLIAGPILAITWRRLDGPRLTDSPLTDSPRPVSGLVKLAGGMLVLGAGVAVLLAAGGDAPTPMPVLALSALLTALGELCLIPIGQAMVTKLAPARSATMAMGAWLTLAALGTGLLPMLTLGPSAPGPLFIGGVAILAIAAGGLLLSLAPKLRAWMHGAEDPAPPRTWGCPYRGAAPRSDAETPETSESAKAAKIAYAEAMPARRMAIGALWTLGGLVVTLASFTATDAGGPYVVAHGAILYGVITFLRGLAGWGKRP